MGGGGIAAQAARRQATDPADASPERPTVGRGADALRYAIVRLASLQLLGPRLGRCSRRLGWHYLGGPAMSAARCRLDARPSDRQRIALRRLDGGFRLALFPDGTCRSRQTHEVVLWATVEALLRRQWITEPGYPLFSDPGAGSITERGRTALWR